MSAIPFGDILAWVVLIVGIIIFAFGIFGKRFASAKIPKLSDEMPLRSVNEAQINAIVTARLDDFLATRLRGEFVTHAQTHAQDEKIAKVWDEARVAKGSAQVSFDFTKTENAALRTQIGAILDEMKATTRKWDDWTHSHACDQDQRFKWVDRGFLAIWHRELMSEIEQRIDEKSDWLLRSRRGERIDNWGQWNHRKGEFTNDVLEWLRLAESYAPGISNRVNDIPHHRLIGDWSEPDDLFPNVDAITAYRAAAVLLENYQGQRPLAHRALESAAFHSPSMKG